MIIVPELEVEECYRILGFDMFPHPNYLFFVIIGTGSPAKGAMRHPIANMHPSHMKK